MRDTAVETLVARSAAGQQELETRQRGLSQRHRTVLLLADGKRDLDRVLTMAAAAGAGRSHFDELRELGLLELSVPTPPAAPPAAAIDTVGPATTPPRPRPIERARALLIEALKQYAPVSGALLTRRIRRAEWAHEIEVLLDEAEAKMARPGTLVQVSQVVRRARDLLARES